MGFTVEMLPWIGGLALAAAAASAVWIVRETMREMDAFLRDSRAHAAETRRAFGQTRARPAVEAETGTCQERALRPPAPARRAADPTPGG